MPNPDIDSSGIDPGILGSQDWTGCSVAPRTRMRRLPCSISARTYTFVPFTTFIDHTDTLTCGCRKPMPPGDIRG